VIDISPRVGIIQTLDVMIDQRVMDLQICMALPVVTTMSSHLLQGLVATAQQIELVTGALQIDLEMPLHFSHRSLHHATLIQIMDD
jgi:hypothetical protein